uniref:Si:dkey-6i22.5 n=1 Tax=Lepisosteus oculatus TaxID=7918 RepID=W5MQN3_LEPOC
VGTGDSSSGEAPGSSRPAAAGPQAGQGGDVSTQMTDLSKDRTEPKPARLKTFNRVMERSLQKLINDISFQRFAQTFHPLYKESPQVTESIHRQFVSQLQDSIREDIAQIVEEGDLEVKFEELDRLEKAAEDSMELAWRPSGVPEEDLCGFVMPYYLQQQEYLRRELRKLQKENASLAQKVLAGREAIARAEQQLSQSVEELQAASVRKEDFLSPPPPSPQHHYRLL